MFGIFDLAFTKIVDPTIFVRESFIFARNSLARRAGAFFFTRNSFARRAQFLRPSPPILSRIVRPCSSIEATVLGSPVFARAKKEGGAWGEKKSRVRGGLVSRETTTTWGVRARQGFQDSRDIKIAKPLCLCKNAKFGPSNAKFAKMHKSNAKLLESNF